MINEDDLIKGVLKWLLESGENCAELMPWVTKRLQPETFGY